MLGSVKDIRGKRVAIGLSGGVDSAVAAALLVQAGAQVTGVFAKGWYPPGMPCTWAEDRRDAMRVAARLSIPFRTLDASAEYKKGVIDYLLAEYAAGRTPNPDVMCNRDVKFGALWRFAHSPDGLGAEFLATGHYARRGADAGGSPTLLRGIDPAKDQSYFLWAVPQDVLGHVLFPLGSMNKDETRALARALKLPVAQKRDSQGICFLGSISVEEFLRHEFSPERGIARDAEGKEIGAHDGAILHTIGERVTLDGAPQGPWYVVAKDIAANELIVSNAPKRGAARASVGLTSVNWISPDRAAQLSAQYRYHGPVIEGRLADSAAAGGARFEPAAPLDEPLAAGQSLVLYDGDRVVGGGIIAE